MKTKARGDDNSSSIPVAKDLSKQDKGQSIRQTLAPVAKHLLKQH
jgi:hypothetical protein